jgi:hypothetical protein
MLTSAVMMVVMMASSQSKLSWPEYSLPVSSRVKVMVGALPAHAHTHTPRTRQLIQ